MTTVNLKTINNLICSLTEAIETVKKDVANLEETYRKMLEEAKTSMMAQIEEMSSQLAYWEAVRDNGTAAPQPKTRKPRKKAAEKTEEVAEEPVNEEKVVDEDEVKPEEVTTEETVESDSDELPFGNPAEEKAETVAQETETETEPESEPETEIESSKTESEETTTEDAKEEGWGGDDDEWANFTKEW